jgi:hypothetical protein
VFVPAIEIFCDECWQRTATISQDADLNLGRYRPSHSDDPHAHHGGGDLITAIQPLPDVRQGPTEPQERCRLSCQPLGASLASMVWRASPPSPRKSGCGCCSGSDETLPSRWL